MNWFTHRTARRRSRRLLPGHAQSASRRDLPPIPGIDPAERRARRARWGNEQTWRFDRTELTGRIAVALSAAVMMLVVLSALSTPTHALERAQTIQASTPTPALVSSTAADQA